MLCNFPFKYRSNVLTGGIFMKKVKRVFWVLLAVPVLILSGCVEEETNENISTKLVFSADGEGTFIIKNEARKEVVLTTTSGQQIEFQLINEQKEIMYTYSANKMFIQGIVEKKLQPGEEWKIPLNLQSELAEVPVGSYTLVVWSTAKGLDDQKIETSYDWTGKIANEPTGKLVVKTEEVTYNGQLDSHTIEVENLEGASEVMYLSEVALPIFEDIEPGTKLQVEYVIEKGQKVVQFAQIK